MKNPICQLSLAGEPIKEWKNSLVIKRKLGFDPSGISKCCKGTFNRHTAYGFIWKFKKDMKQPLVKKLKVKLKVQSTVPTAPNNKSEFGAFVKSLRKGADLTLAQLGTKIGCAESTVCKVETGCNGFGDENLKRLADVFDLDFKELQEMSAGKEVSILKPAPKTIVPTLTKEVENQLISSTTFGEYVKILREGKNLTKAQLAAKIGFNSSYVAQIEKSQKRISLKYLRKLSEIFNLDFKQLKKRWAIDNGNREKLQSLKAEKSSSFKDDNAYFATRVEGAIQTFLDQAIEVAFNNNMELKFLKTLEAVTKNVSERIVANYPMLKSPYFSGEKELNNAKEVVQGTKHSHTVSGTVKVPREELTGECLQCLAKFLPREKRLYKSAEITNTIDTINKLTNVKRMQYETYANLEYLKGLAGKNDFVEILS